MPRKTEVSIVGEAFHINGQPTYEAAPGRARRSRGCCSTAAWCRRIFDDLNPETVEQLGLSRHRQVGRRAQHPRVPRRHARVARARPAGLHAQPAGRQPAGLLARSSPGTTRRSTADGELRPDYLERLERILDRADELGMVVILGIFYFGQDERLRTRRPSCGPSTTRSTGSSTAATATC